MYSEFLQRGDEFALVNMSTNGVTSKQLKSKLMNGRVFVAVQAGDEMQSLDTESMLPVKGDYNDRSKICTQPVHNLTVTKGTVSMLCLRLLFKRMYNTIVN